MTNFDAMADIERAPCNCEVTEIEPEYIEVHPMPDTPEGTLDFLTQWIPPFPMAPL